MGKQIDIGDIHDRIMNIAREFHNIMVNNKIPYYMIGGTMLGAVRHKGFIPWDDDMDMGIPRPYYAKALKVLKENLAPQYRVLHNVSAVHCDKTKIEDCSTIILEIGKENRTDNTGVFIDIFPLDYGNNKYGFFSKNKWIHHILRINDCRNSWPKLFHLRIAALFARLFPKDLI